MLQRQRLGSHCSSSRYREHQCSSSVHTVTEEEAEGPVPKVNDSAVAYSLDPPCSHRILSRTLYRWMPSVIHLTAVQVLLLLRKARPPSQLRYISKNRVPNSCASHREPVKEREARADAWLPGEWPIYKFNNSQRGAGSTRATPVIGETSTSQFSVN